MTVRSVSSRTRRVLARGDLAGAAATLTYFAAIAVVPWAVLAIWSTTWVFGVGGAEQRWSQLRALIPPDMGARPVFDQLVSAATHLDVLGAIVLLFPASFYGEGLRRACLPFCPDRDRFTGWRARAAILVLLPALPAVGFTYLAMGMVMTQWTGDSGGGGAGDLVARIVVGYMTVWVLLSVVLSWVYWKVTPGAPSNVSAIVCGVGTASFIAGFVQGFSLFLSLDIDVGIPYAGLRVIGGVVAVGLWLYVLHVLVVVGWAFVQAVEEERHAHVR